MYIKIKRVPGIKYFYAKFLWIISFSNDLSISPCKSFVEKLAAQRLVLFYFLFFNNSYSFPFIFISQLILSCPPSSVQLIAFVHGIPKSHSLRFWQLNYLQFLCNIQNLVRRLRTRQWVPLHSLQILRLGIVRVARGSKGSPQFNHPLHCLEFGSILSRGL